MLEIDILTLLQQLKRVGRLIEDLNNMCGEMREQISTAHSHAAPMLREASLLTAQKEELATNQKLLKAFNKHFIVSDEDLTLLTSSVEPVNERYFEILARVQQIRRDCEVLLGSEDQTLGLELMEQTSRNLDAAFQKLFNWVQREFKALNIDNPHVSGSVRRALRVLAERPSLFERCLDFFAEAREHTLSNAFHFALTDSTEGGSDPSRSSKPIDLQTHDLLRYVGDMLAWVHSAAVSEKEALEGLFIVDGDEIARELQAGRASEPWSQSRTSNSQDASSVSPPIFDGRKALNDLVNRDLEGVSRVLKHKIEIGVASNDDALLVFNTLNLLKFYEEIFGKLVGTPSALVSVTAELQTSTFSHFERLLQDEILAAAHNETTVPEDLGAPLFLTTALDRLAALIKVYPDLATPDLTRLLSAAIVPFLNQCAELASSASSLTDTAQNIFQLNYLLVSAATLRPILPESHSFLAVAGKKIAEVTDELVDTQHDFLLRGSGVERLLDALDDPPKPIDTKEGASTSVSATVAQAPFDIDTLAAAAVKLDDFLPSALMDVMESLARIQERRVAKEIAARAAEEFCEDFERVEERVLVLDEQAGKRGKGGRDGSGNEDEGEDEDGDQDEEEEILLREVFPRTTAEIRVLLS